MTPAEEQQIDDYLSRWYAGDVVTGQERREFDEICMRYAKEHRRAPRPPARQARPSTWELCPRQANGVSGSFFHGGKTDAQHSR